MNPDTIPLLLVEQPDGSKRFLQGCVLKLRRSSREIRFAEEPGVEPGDETVLFYDSKNGFVRQCHRVVRVRWRRDSVTLKVKPTGEPMPADGARGDACR